MTAFETLADFAAMCGHEIGTSEWLEITQDRIDRFADATGDHQWIHVDPARTASELGMPTIAHGYLTLSLVPRFVSEIMHIESIKRAINYGSNKVRFISMVPVGSKVRGRLRLDKAVADTGMLRATSTMTVEIEGEPRPALVAETITLYFE